MARTLDFIVYGVPRSGTSALGHAINLAPDIFCGLEYFPLWHDFEGVDVPAAFLNAVPRTDADKAEASRKALRQKLRAGAVKRYGDKNPRFYLTLDAVNRANDGPANVFLHRPARETCESWTRRAQDPETPWRSGESGIYAIAESVFALAEAFHPDRDTLVADYQTLFFGDEGAMRRVVGAIAGPPPHEFPYPAFKKQFFDQEKFRNRAGAPREAEAALIEALGFGEIDAAIAARGVAPARDFYAEIYGELAPAAAQLGARLAEALPDLPAEEQAFFRNWKMMMLRGAYRSDIARMAASGVAAVEAPKPGG